MTDKPLISIVLLERGADLHEAPILQILAIRVRNKKACVHRSDVELIASVTQTRNEVVWSRWGDSKLRCRRLGKSAFGSPGPNEWDGKN